MENYTRFTNFKELDSFIQSSLDKYFYVEPWKILYERTGKLHRDIISDKSTIPDLIIYNKTFNKAECFIGNKEKSYIEFPRIRFILRPKFRKEYNPTCTYGKKEQAYFYNKEKISDNKSITSDNKKNSFLSSKGLFEDEKIINKDDKQNVLKHNSNIISEQKFEINEKKQYSNNWKNIEDEDDEEEPEWANDNVEDYDKIKIEFKAIPKSVEDKMNEELGLFSDNINNIDLDKVQKSKIDIDSFFKSDEENCFDDIQNKTTNKNNENYIEEIKDFMNDKNNKNNEESNSNKKEINNDNYHDNNQNIHDIDNNPNLHLNIFDIENRFNHIFIEPRLNEIDNINNAKNKDYQGNSNNLNKNDFFNNYNQDIRRSEQKGINNVKEINENKIKKTLMIQNQKQRNQQLYQLFQNNYNNFQQQQSSNYLMNNSNF